VSVDAWSASGTRIGTDGVFAYTWDLVGDDGAAARIADLGVHTVALQAAYHSVRAFTPFHPRHRVVHAQHAAAYFRLRPERWTGRLRPPAPSWGVPDDDPFGTAAAALTAAGLRVEAWIVLTHSSALASANPDLAVRNAYGEAYAYALCPAHAEVREYALGLIRDVSEQYPDVAALALEACGWLGFDHGSHHEKTAGADLSPVGRSLLSVCLCAACAAALDARGLDVEKLADDIRAAVDAEVQRGVSPGESLDEAVGPDRAQVLYDHRADVIGDLVKNAAGLACGRELVLMATDEPSVTGPDVGIDFTRFDGPVDAYMLKCWGDPDAAEARLAAAAERTQVPLIANVSVLEDPIRPLGHPHRIYHAGLASPARLAAIRAAVSKER
jgi:hypothetical protein